MPLLIKGVTSFLYCLCVCICMCVYICVNILSYSADPTRWYYIIATVAMRRTPLIRTITLRINPHSIRLPTSDL